LASGISIEYPRQQQARILLHEQKLVVAPGAALPVRALQMSMPPRSMSAKHWSFRCVDTDCWWVLQASHQRDRKQRFVINRA
jgi:hypothetical protein